MLVIVVLWGAIYPLCRHHTHCPVCVIRRVWQLLTVFLGHYLSTHCCVSVYARLHLSLHAQQGTASSFITVITGIMTSVGDKRYSTAGWKPETVTEFFLERAVKVATTVKKSDLAVFLISIHQNECVHPSGACSSTAVWSECCKQQQHHLNRCNTACLLAGLTDLFIAPKCMQSIQK